MAYDIESVDPVEEARTVAGAARSLDHDRQIDVSLAPEPIVVAGDPDRLQQVLTNLIDNAHTAAPPGTAIEIDASVDGEGAVVSVRDHGPGLSAEGLERVFEKFVRTGPAP